MGARANTKRMARGTSKWRCIGVVPAVAGSVSVRFATAVVLSLRREQAGRPEEEHRRHQNVDQHRCQRSPGLARRSGVERKAEKVWSEGAPDRVDETDEESRQERALDRPDAADD